MSGEAKADRVKRNGAPRPLLKRLNQILRRGEGESMRQSLEEVIEESERENPALSRPEREMLANLLKFRSQAPEPDPAPRRRRIHAPEPGRGDRGERARESRPVAARAGDARQPAQVQISSA